MLLTWYAYHPEAGKLSSNSAQFQASSATQRLYLQPVTFLSCLGFALAVADS